MSKGNKKFTISATDQIRNLWQKGVFKAQKTSPEIDALLAKDGYNFSTAELSMALARANYLTRKGKRGSYVYIQKGPYFNEQ